MEEDSRGRTQFYLRANEGNLSCVEAMAQEARRIGKLEELIENADEEGRTSLYEASFYNYTNVAKYLLRNGAMPDAALNNKSSWPGETPLTTSCYYGHEEIVVLLLKYGANVEHQRPDGGDCAYDAAAGNQLNILQLGYQVHLIVLVYFHLGPNHLDSCQIFILICKLVNLL